MCAVF
jgi:hypothetical protein